MNSIKIVRRYFTKAEAKNAVIYQKADAVKNCKSIEKIEVLDAYKLYGSKDGVKDITFREVGKPVVGQFVVIVYYKSVEKIVEKEDVAGRIIKLKVRKVIIRKDFAIVNYKKAIGVDGHLRVVRSIFIVLGIQRININMRLSEMATLNKIAA